jgi:hypothetical protein
MRFAISPRISRLALAILLLGMPCLAIGTLVNPILQAGTIDPYVYTGLLHDYLQVLRRYGATYYANRVAFTVPARAAIALLGDADGHFLFQTLYLTAATLSSFALSRRYFSKGVGIATAAWVAFNPWLIRTLTWDYVEGSSVCTLLMAFCCFGFNRGRPLLLHAAGGLALALACNANPFSAVMAAAFAPAWLILNAPSGIAPCLARMMVALAAFATGYAGLIMVEYIELPELGFGRELVTFGVGMQLLHGAGEVWYRSISDVVAEGSAYIFLPGFLLAGLVVQLGTEIFAGRRTERFALAAGSCLALTCLAYLIFHYYFRTAIMTFFLYDGYAFPAALLVVTALLGGCAQALPASKAGLLCAAATLCFVGLWLGYAGWRLLLESMTVGTFAMIGSGLVIAMAVGRLPALRAMAVLAGTVLGIAVFYFSNERSRSPVSESIDMLPRGTQYEALHDPTLSAREADIYRAAVSLQRDVGKTLAVDEGPVGFWYAHDPAFESVQSTYLYQYSWVPSKIMPQDPGTHLDANLRDRLARYPHIVILSHTQEEADAASQALGADGAAVRLRARFTFSGSWFGFVTTVTDYSPPVPPVGDTVAVIAPGSLVAQANAEIMPTKDGIELSTAPQRWAYSAVTPLTAGGLPSAKLILRIRMRVFKGAVGLIIAGTDVSSAPITEVPVGVTPIPRDFDLAIPDGAAAGHLIIRNTSPFGSSRVGVSKITMFRAPT